MSQTTTKGGAPAELRVSANRRDADMFVAANRHSNRVRILKLAIPAVALAGVALLASVTIFRPETAAGVSTEGVGLADGRIVMANPKLDGMTGDKRPYSMRAERAYQEVKKDGLIELETITAEMPFGAETTAQLIAGGGFFDNTNNLLDLAKGVRLVTSDGMVAKLRSARIDIAKNGLSTTEPVDITTKGSHITADAFSVSDGGKLMIFEKRVRLTIDPKKLNNTTSGADAPQTE